jgi:hypothetical protein
VCAAVGPPGGGTTTTATTDAFASRPRRDDPGRSGLRQQSVLVADRRQRSSR